MCVRTCVLGTREAISSAADSSLRSASAWACCAKGRGARRRMPASPLPEATNTSPELAALRDISPMPFTAITCARHAAPGMSGRTELVRALFSRNTPHMLCHMPQDVREAHDVQSHYLNYKTDAKQGQPYSALVLRGVLLGARILPGVQKACHIIRMGNFMEGMLK